MNFRKLLVAGALSCTLAVSSGVVALPNHAFAVEFSDTQGVETEASINKLVSLGVMKNPGATFNPEEALTRAEFAYMVNQVVALKAGNQVGFKDLAVKNSNYTNVLKLVNNGYLAADKNGNVSINKGVTYLEMAKFLAQSLGFKSKWTNSPADFLFYLVKKDVLDIDTDLDAVVTREDAAVAFDSFITQKGTFSIVNGIVTGVSSKGKFTINNGKEYKTYTNAANISIFVDGQSTTADEMQVGSPVTVYLNKKGQAAYYSGTFLDAETGPIVIKGSNMTIGAGLVKTYNIDAFVGALPNRSKELFSLKEIDTYIKNGCSFAGQAFYTSQDEVTAVYPYISKIADAGFKLKGNQVTVVISEDDEIYETFNTSIDLTVTLDGKAATLADLPGDATATITADQTGTITSIAAKSAEKE